MAGRPNIHKLRCRKAKKAGHKAVHCFCIALCDVQGRTVGLSALFVLLALS